jgi:hypothetical protein
MLNLNYNIIGTLGKGVETISPGGIQYTGVNYLSSGSTYNNGGTTFTIERNYIAIGGGTEILVQNTITSSIIGGLIIEYEDEFQVTASISGSKNWPDSSSFQALTMSLSIPQIGFYVTSSNTASIISASFGNNLTIFRDPYTITASVELEPYPSYSLTEFVFVGGGGNGGAAAGGNQSGGGGGAGAIISGSGLWIYANSIYTVNVGGDSSFVTASIQYIKAAAGGNGGSGDSTAGVNGGNGGGGTGNGLGGAATGSIIPTGSAVANISSSLGIFVTASIIGGNSGGDGAIVISGPTPPQNTFFNAGGGGGASGAGQQALTILQGRRAGGAGLTGNPYLTGSISIGGESGASPGGLGGTPEGVNGDNATTIGSGGGGAKGGTTPPASTTGGTGGSGIAIIRYLGPQKGRGGVVTTDGSYIIHTFYQSGYFYSTANMTPKKH